MKKIQLGSQEDPPVRNKTPSDSHSTHIRKTTHHREIKGTNNNIYYKNHLQFTREGWSFFLTKKEPKTKTRKESVHLWCGTGSVCVYNV